MKKLNKKTLPVVLVAMHVIGIVILIETMPDITSLVFAIAVLLMVSISSSKIIFNVISRKDT